MPDSAAAARQMMIIEFADWLWSRTSRDGRLFQDDTVSAYRTQAIQVTALGQQVGQPPDGSRIVGAGPGA